MVRMARGLTDALGESFREWPRFLLGHRPVRDLGYTPAPRGLLFSPIRWGWSQ